MHAGATLVYVWCNPLDRLMTSCNYYQCPCAHNLTELGRVAQAFANAARNADIERACELTCETQGINLQPVAALVRGMQSEWGKTRVLHREFMNARPVATFEALASALGATGTFPASQRFRIHNSKSKGRRQKMLRESPYAKLKRMHKSLREEYLFDNELRGAEEANIPSDAVKDGTALRSCRWGYGCNDDFWHGQDSLAYALPRSRRR